MTQYPYPNSSAQGLQGIAVSINDASGGLLTPMLLLVAFVVMLVSQLEFGFVRALVNSSLMCSITAIFLSVIGLLSVTYMYWGFVMLGLSLLLLRLNLNQ